MWNDLTTYFKNNPFSPLERDESSYPYYFPRRNILFSPPPFPSPTPFSQHFYKMHLKQPGCLWAHLGISIG